MVSLSHGTAVFSFRLACLLLLQEIFVCAAFRMESFSFSEKMMNCFINSLSLGSLCLVCKILKADIDDDHQRDGKRT